MKESKLIPHDGPATVIHPANGKKFTLEEMQKFVGGYFELIATMRDGRRLFMNEDGKQLRLPENKQATQLFQTLRPIADTIVGNAVLIAPEEID